MRPVPGSMAALIGASEPAAKLLEMAPAKPVSKKSAPWPGVVSRDQPRMTLFEAEATGVDETERAGIAVYEAEEQFYWAIRQAQVPEIPVPDLNTDGSSPDG